MSFIEKHGYGQPHIDFAQALVQLARDYGVRNFNGSFCLSWDRQELGWSGDSVNISWSEGRHGDDSNIVLRCEQSAVVPEIAPQSASIDPRVYFDGEDFLELGSGKSKGDKYRDRWIHRADDFPRTPQDVLAVMHHDSAAWFIKKWPSLRDDGGKAKP